MEKILKEILEIPDRAKKFWESPVNTKLPLKVPYLGMGSSYFSPLAFKLMGIPILVEMASEYYYYLSLNKILSHGVILSQSGQSSEALWCARLFEKYIAISNYIEKPLCTNGNVVAVIDIHAGEEHYSSSKTYINTLLALFKGFGLDAGEAVSLIQAKMGEYAQKGEEMANSVFEIINKRPIHGIYILGSGPNYATALEAALILSESTKRNFHGLAMAQYDHGPKETAAHSIVIQILAKGPAYVRSLQLSKTISKAGAEVIHVEEPEVGENFSILNNIIPFNFMAYYLAIKLGIGETFQVGGKVTESDEN